MDARVIHQDVDPPERRHRLLGQAMSGLFTGNVAHNRTVLSFTQFSRDRIQRLGVDIIEHEEGPFAGKQYRSGSANSATGARYDRNFVLKPHSSASPSGILAAASRRS